MLPRNAILNVKLEREGLSEYQVWPSPVNAGSLGEHAKDTIRNMFAKEMLMNLRPEVISMPTSL